MKKITILLSCMFTYTVCFAQPDEPERARVAVLEERIETLDDAVGKLKKLKVSGYVQTQFQYGEKNASLKVGAANVNKNESFNRIGIRRGRIKFVYTEGIVAGVFQLDITEKGVGFKDAYLKVKDPWVGRNSFSAGVFNRPFGFEIAYSSSRRESPERSTVIQRLFPDERDLGGMIILQPSKTSAWNFLKLEAGLFAGNGIKQETDNRRDFIGHLSANPTIGCDISVGLGVSYYNGGVYQGSENVYTMKDGGFVLDSRQSNVGEFAKREYIGFDSQFNLSSLLGMTQLRAEYLFGTQPGTKSSSKSPNSSTISDSDTYIRNFKGGYAMLVQDFGTLPVSAVVKYDWYDPNTKIAKNQIGTNGTGIGDVAYNTLGFGLLWRTSQSVRLLAYYEAVRNETSDNLSGHESDIKDNAFTLRLQYKF